MKTLRALLVCIPLGLTAGHAHAQEFPASAGVETMKNMFYIGGGSSRHDGAFENDDTPYSIGFMRQAENSKAVFGLDIGREGTMIDSTWGRDDALVQATSFNLLLGGNVYNSGKLRSDAAVLIGARESFVDCPDSNLGYKCYADREPETEYKGNFGAVLTVSYDRVALGVRATGESTQLLAGFRF